MAQKTDSLRSPARKLKDASTSGGRRFRGAENCENSTHCDLLGRYAARETKMMRKSVVEFGAPSEQASKTKTEQNNEKQEPSLAFYLLTAFVKKTKKKKQDLDE